MSKEQQLPSPAVERAMCGFMDAFIDEEYDNLGPRKLFELCRFLTPEKATEIIRVFNRWGVVVELSWRKRIGCWSVDAISDKAGTRVTR